MKTHIFSSVWCIGLAVFAFSLTSLAWAADSLPAKTKSGKTSRTISVAPVTPPPPPNQPVQEKLTVPKGNAPKKLTGKLYFKAPVQGDYFTQGETITIRWDRQGNIGENCFQLFLFKGISHIMEITNQVGYYHYQWTVPNNLSGSGYKFRLRTCDKNYYADSDSFPILSSKPDFMVAQHSITPQNNNIPGGDMRIRFKARIDNIGHGSAAVSTARLEMWPSKGGAQMIREDFSIPALEFGSGGHQYISKDLTLPFSGLWTYRFIADFTNQVQEAGENSTGPSQTDQNLGNNLVVGSYNVGELPDLAIQSLFKDPEHAQYINRTVTISGAVDNEGTAAARNVKVSVFCTKCNMGLASGSKFMVHSETIPIVWAGDRHWFSFNFKWPCMGVMTCRAIADSDNAFQEFKEDNNEKSINVRIKLL